MALDTAVDSNVLSYPMLVFMKEQGAVVGRGGACPQTSSEAEPALSRRTTWSSALGGRVRRSQPLGVGRGAANLRSYGQEVQLRSCLFESINV